MYNLIYCIKFSQHVYQISTFCNLDNYKYFSDIKISFVVNKFVVFFFFFFCIILMILLHTNVEHFARCNYIIIYIIQYKVYFVR